MKRVAIIWALAAILSGCDTGLRNSPAQQVEDYAICKAAGMGTYQNRYGEILCREVRP